MPQGWGHTWTTSSLTLLSFPFSEEEAKGSSTFRELLVLEKFYASRKARRYAGRSILPYCDNKGVCSIMVKVSGRPHLQVLAMKVFLACRELNIALTAW